MVYYWTQHNVYVASIIMSSR